jgi:hypothetical protein
MSVLFMLKMIVLGVIGHLEKASDLRGPAAGEEERNVLREFEVAILCARLAGFGAGKECLEPGAQGQCLQQFHSRSALI